MSCQIPLTTYDINGITEHKSLAAIMRQIQFVARQGDWLFQWPRNGHEANAIVLWQSFKGYIDQFEVIAMLLTNGIAKPIIEMAREMQAIASGYCRTLRKHAHTLQNQGNLDMGIKYLPEKLN